MNLIDTHCHLYEPPLSHDTGAVLRRAADRGVTRIIVPAYDLASWDTTADLANRPGVFAAYGLHPWRAHDLPGRTARPASDDPPGGTGTGGEALAAFRARLGARLAACPHVAVGEIGLDTKIDTSGLEQQLPLLRVQLELARDLDLPVILHCRGAFTELLAELRRVGGKLRGVLHAFSRGPELARQFTEAGLHLGLGGAVTRDRAKQVRKAARLIPPGRLLLETDAPSIGLDGVLPENTEPCHIADIAAALAALRGESVATVAETTTANARDLFRLDS